MTPRRHRIRRRSQALPVQLAGATFRAGDTVNFSGSGSDPEDGPLAATRLTWWAELHHDAHTHPFLPETEGNSGSVSIPTRGETSDNIFYRFHLRATDSAGLTSEVTRDIQPQKSQITLTTAPVGLVLTLDGQPVTTPIDTDRRGRHRTRHRRCQTRTANGRRYSFSELERRRDAPATRSQPRRPIPPTPPPSPTPVRSTIRRRPCRDSAGQRRHRHGGYGDHAECDSGRQRRQRDQGRILRRRDRARRGRRLAIRLAVDADDHWSAQPDRTCHRRHRRRHYKRRDRCHDQPGRRRLAAADRDHHRAGQLRQRHHRHAGVQRQCDRRRRRDQRRVPGRRHIRRCGADDRTVLGQRRHQRLCVGPACLACACARCGGQPVGVDHSYRSASEAAARNRPASPATNYGSPA